MYSTLSDFLMYDDEVDCDEANDDEPNPEEFQSLDNSGWSSRTRYDWIS